MRPHLGQVCLVVASVFTSCRFTVWTEDSFWRRSEGKSEGFDLVTMVFEAVSTRCSLVESPHSVSDARINSTHLGSQHHSIRTAERSWNYPWMREADCRSRCRKQEIQLQPSCQLFLSNFMRLFQSPQKLKFIHKPRAKAHEILAPEIFLLGACKEQGLDMLQIWGSGSNRRSEIR